MDPGLVIWNEFWSETMMVRCSASHMKFLFGHQQKDVYRSMRRVRGWVIRGLGVLVGLMDGRLLRGVKTKYVGSFLPRHPHGKMVSVVECRP